jgi:peroxiredoxin
MRDDSEMLTIFQGFQFDEAGIAEYLEKYPVKRPDPLPRGAKFGVFGAGPVYGIFEKSPDGASAKLTLDVNTNYDLTDDTPLDLVKVEDIKDGPLIQIARSYERPEPHTEWLPYRLAYRERLRPDGKIEDSLSLLAHYTFKGDFELGGVPHEVRLYDGDTRARFDREKSVNVTLRVGPKNDFDRPASVRHHRPYELVPLAGALYEVRDMAEDGSWLEFAPSGLEPTSLGKAAPDFEMTDTDGTAFRVSDYRGKVVVLDFWYVWCKPCLAKFPAIKAMIEKYADRPFAAVGVNIDDAARVEQAKKIIGDYGLTWRQVVEGLGEFIPVYQIYGRLPERPMSFPIYVAVDEKGVTRYATNDFEKMGRFLESHFNDPAGPENSLFVPLLNPYGRTDETRTLNAVDFTGPRVRELEASGKLKFPAGAPADARIGLLSNGIPLVAYPARDAGKFILIFDSNHDSDLNGEETHEISVLGETGPDVPEESKIKVGLELPYANGAIGFMGWPFYARGSAGREEWPVVFYEGRTSHFGGSFFVEKKEYMIEIADTNGDRLFTDRDTAAPGFLRLKIKQEGEWVDIHEGTRRIPIGKAHYKLRFVSDDGYLVELEKETR